MLQRAFSGIISHVILEETLQRGDVWGARIGNERDGAVPTQGAENRVISFAIGQRERGNGLTEVDEMTNTQGIWGEPREMGGTNGEPAWMAELRRVAGELGEDMNILKGNYLLCSNGLMVSEEAPSAAFTEYMLEERNEGNRSLSERRSTQLMELLADHDFAFNGETVKIDTDFILADGQHRFWASREAGAPLRSLFVWNCPPDVRLTVDEGGRRTLAQRMKWMGYENSSDYSNARVMLYHYRNNGFNGIEIRPTPPQINRMENIEDTAIYRGIEWGRTTSKQLKVNAGIMGFLYHEFYKADQEMAEDFCERFATGANLPLGHPILLARQRFEADMNRGTSYRAFQTSEQRAAIIVKAWNMIRREGEDARPKTLMYRPSVEKFPKVI